MTTAAQRYNKRLNEILSPERIEAATRKTWVAPYETTGNSRRYVHLHVEASVWVVANALLTPQEARALAAELISTANLITKTEQGER